MVKLEMNDKVVKKLIGKYPDLIRKLKVQDEKSCLKALDKKPLSSKHIHIVTRNILLKMVTCRKITIL